MEQADLYLDTIRLSSYLSESECRKCGADSCKDLVQMLLLGAADCSRLDSEGLEALNAVSVSAGAMPEVPRLTLPRPGTPGLTEINSPSDGAPILVTSDNQYTQEVLMTVLATATAPFYLLCTDTGGDSLDMALILGSFTEAAIIRCLEQERLQDIAPSSPLILPGKASALQSALAASTGREVRVGPVCAVELPLYFKDYWIS